MISKKDVYIRYNNMLLRHFTDFVNQNRTLFSENNQKELLSKLKVELDRSAIINKRIPSKYVPMKKVYKKLYSELFKNKPFNESYLSLLSNSELSVVNALNKTHKENPKLKKKIEKINNLISESYSNSKSPYFKLILKQIKFPKLILSKIVITLLLTIQVSSFSIDVTKIEENPFLSDNSKIERMQRLAYNYAYEFNEVYDVVNKDIGNSNKQWTTIANTENKSSVQLEKYYDDMFKFLQRNLLNLYELDELNEGTFKEIERKVINMIKTNFSSDIFTFHIINNSRLMKQLKAKIVTTNKPLTRRELNEKVSSVMEKMFLDEGILFLGNAHSHLSGASVKVNHQTHRKESRYGDKTISSERNTNRASSQIVFGINSKGEIVIRVVVSKSLDLPEAKFIDGQLTKDLNYLNYTTIVIGYKNFPELEKLQKQVVAEYKSVISTRR